MSTSKHVSHRYQVRQIKGGKDIPDKVVFKTNNIEEARRVMSDYQDKYPYSFYIWYTKAGLKAWDDIQKYERRTSHNNKNMPSIADSVYDASNRR